MGMRNSELTKIRDRKMVEQFYHLYDVKRIRLDDVLLQLSEKVFFLSTDYIYKRIFYNQENYAYYEHVKHYGIKKNKTDAAQMSINFGQI